MNRLTFTLMGVMFLFSTPVRAEEVPPAGELPHSEAPAPEETAEPAPESPDTVQLRPYQAIYKVALGAILITAGCRRLRGVIIPV
jgi:hypothetical protein